MRLNERSTVLFPQPDGPMMAVIFWGVICMLDIFYSSKTAII